MILNRFKYCIVTAVFTGAVSLASAQDFSPLSEFATTIGTTTAQSHAWGDVMRNVYGKGSKGSAVKHKPTSVSIAKSQLNYQPTTQLSKAALAAYVASLRKNSPVDADKAAQVLARVNINQLYSAAVAPYGLANGNLADSFTAYAVLGWMIVNRQTTVSRQNVMGTRDKFAMQLAGHALSDNIASSSEMLKLMFVTLDAGWQTSRKNGTEAAYRNSVANQFASTGLDFKMLKLTPSGFAFR